MSDDLIEIEEEEHTSPLTAPTFKRILGLVMPHKRWLIGFLATIALTAALDALFTYINRAMIDQGIVQKSIPSLLRLASYYGGLQLTQAVLVFTFIFLAGILGERIQ